MGERTSGRLRGQAAVKRTPFSTRSLRGQAAVEYLTTYGWALLALVIVIAILVSTGIFSPSYLVAEECSFGNNLKCEAAVFNSGPVTDVRFSLFNGLPYKVKVVSVNLQTAEGISVDGFPQNIELDSGEKFLYEGTTSEQIPTGAVKRFSGNITYVSCASELGPECSTVEHPLSGRMTARVIE
ncbi:MAG: hypothetical protein V1827_02430 [Candidatus Micrarchaeota archaeon]